MSDILTKMLAELSDDDRHIFDQLSNRLKQSGGDISKLSADDLELIKLMESKYGEAIEQTNKKFVAQNKVNEKQTVNILDMPFAQQVRQILARELGAEFPLEEDAVAFVFENKWLPIECQDEKLAEDLYNRFEKDIVEANHWREELVDAASDKKMAVGLAWFMVIFQLHKRLTE